MLASSEHGRIRGRGKGQGGGNSKGKTKIGVKKGECYKCHQKGKWKKNCPLLQSQNIDKHKNIASSSASITLETSNEKFLVVQR